MNSALREILHQLQDLTQDPRWSGPGPPLQLYRLQPRIWELSRLAGPAGYSLSSHSKSAQRNGEEDLKSDVTCAEPVGSLGHQSPPPAQSAPSLCPQPGSSRARLYLLRCSPLAGPAVAVWQVPRDACRVHKTTLISSWRKP